MDIKDKRKEIEEAIEAGEDMLISLVKTKRSLNKARGWGMVDMLGGSTISGLMKHSKIHDAQNELQVAKADAIKFRNELADVQDVQGINIDIGDFLSFADLFIDGFFVDVMVQSKIKKAQRQLDDAINKTIKLIVALRKQL